jgi:toxin ParE1/3/4
VNITFHPEAQMERLEAVAYYKLQRLELGRNYEVVFNDALIRVHTYPDRYKIELQPNIRKLSLDKFPYNIIYRQIENQIEVLAVAHQSRRPNYWHNRLQAT